MLANPNPASGNHKEVCLPLPCPANACPLNVAGEGQGLAIERTPKRSINMTPGGVNIALVVLSLHVCITDIMNSSPTPKEKTEKTEKRDIQAKRQRDTGGCCIADRLVFALSA